MNKYIIPACDLIDAYIWINKYSARSIADCQDKIMREFSNIYDENFSDYNEFIDIMDKRYNISIGEIVDIETL